MQNTEASTWAVSGITWYVFSSNSRNGDDENHLCSRDKTFDIIGSRRVYRWHRDLTSVIIPLSTYASDDERSYFREMNWWKRQQDEQWRAVWWSSCHGTLDSCFCTDECGAMKIYRLWTSVTPTCTDICNRNRNWS